MFYFNKLFHIFLFSDTNYKFIFRKSVTLKMYVVFMKDSWMYFDFKTGEI